MGLRVLRDGYIQHAGHDHPESLKVMVEEATEMSRRGNLIEAETMLTNLQQLFESKSGPLNYESLGISFELAVIHIRRRDLASAKYLLEEQYRRLMQLEGTYAINTDKVRNLRERALLCETRHEYAEMRVLVTEAWNVGTASLPANHAEMLFLAHDLPAAEWHTPRNAA